MITQVCILSLHLAHRFKSFIVWNVHLDNLTYLWSVLSREVKSLPFQRTTMGPLFLERICSERQIIWHLMSVNLKDKFVSHESCSLSLNFWSERLCYYTTRRLYIQNLLKWHAGCTHISNGRSFFCFPADIKTSCWIKHIRFHLCIKQS